MILFDGSFINLPWGERIELSISGILSAALSILGLLGFGELLCLLADIREAIRNKE